jgi:hypothetical protein
VEEEKALLIARNAAIDGAVVEWKWVKCWLGLYVVVGTNGRTGVLGVVVEARSAVMGLALDVGVGGLEVDALCFKPASLEDVSLVSVFSSDSVSSSPASSSSSSPSASSSGKLKCYGN